MNPAKKGGSDPDRVTMSPSGTFTQNRVADRRYVLYVPTSYSEYRKSPLLVLLHGCRQTASGFAQNSGAIPLAEKEGMVLVCPEQSKHGNPQRCWNWFDPGHQRRGRGEPSEIASITGRIMDEWGIDPEQVFLAGFSAGGAMAMVMGVLYPDLYAAVGVHSGVQYGVASSAFEAMKIMKEGAGDPIAGGTRAFRTMVESVPEQVYEVPTVVIHGARDERVHVENGHQVAKQAFQMNLLAERRRKQFDGSVDTRVHVEKHVAAGRSFTEVVYENQHQRPLVKKYIIRDLSHAWSGGKKGRRFMDPEGPSAVRLMWKFFRLHRPGKGWGWLGQLVSRCIRAVRGLLSGSSDSP